MLHALARNWWAVLIRGIAAIIFGILAFAWPGATGAALVLLFGAYAFVDGIFAIVAAIRAAQAHERWGAFVIEGIIGLIIAAITFFEPRLTAFALYITIAAWAILTGIFELVAAVRLRKEIQNEWLLILGGVASLVFGILMIVYPLAGILTVIWLIGAYAIVFGVMMIGLALRLRPFAKHEPALVR
ncbi:MAG: HdeD family acid-resistance protein [Candidatus Eremiobacteraeota bacterium]|nr:HdeD family acid-resistance protein [Candidatus Eremiobacteraeota bacterium]